MIMKYLDSKCCGVALDNEDDLTEVKSKPKTKLEFSIEFYVVLTSFLTNVIMIICVIATVYASSVFIEEFNNLILNLLLVGKS